MATGKLAWMSILGVTHPRKGEPAAGIRFRADEHVPSPGAYSKQGRDWAIIFLCTHCMPAAVAGLIFGLTGTACSNIVKKWEETGVVGVASGRGRKRKVSDAQAAEVVARVARKRTHSIGDAVNLSMACATTWARSMRRLGVTIKYIRWKPHFLTAVHRAARVAWCVKTLRAMGRSVADKIAYLKRITFSDSKIFTSDGLHHTYIWVVDKVMPQADDELPRAICRVHAYGAICAAGGSTLVTDVSGTLGRKPNPGGRRGVNADEYRHIAGQLLASIKAVFDADGISGWIWQQDGAKPHTTGNTCLGRQCRGLINSFTEEFWDDWPARSPDLSLIEHVWAEMVRRMRDTRFDSQKAFEAGVKACWAEVTSDKSYMKRLFSSFESRLKLCVKNGGDRVR